MKQSIRSLVALFLICSTFQTQAIALEEKEVQIGISGAFIPSGQRADHEASVIVNGVFQNGCYKWNRAEVNSLALHGAGFTGII